MRVAVVGGGTMGNGIAQVVAVAGLDVTLIDIDAAALERALGRIEKSLARFVKNGTLERADAQLRAAHPEELESLLSART